MIISGKTYDLRGTKITYGQIEELLSELGFARHQGVPGSVWYEHADTDTTIFLADKAANDIARPSEIVSTRINLVAKGFMNEDEFDNKIANGAMTKNDAPKKRLRK